MFKDMDTKIFKEINNAVTEKVTLPQEMLRDYIELFAKTFERSKCYLDYQVYEDDDSGDYKKEELFEHFVKPTEKSVRLQMRLVVPALHDYTLALFSIKFKRSQVYPCKFDNFFVDENVVKDTRDAEELENLIEYVFKCKKFRHAMSMILSQINYEQDGYEAPEFEDD